MEGKKNIVVVAGATGRAGSCIVEEALKKGYQVRALLVKPFDPPQPPGLQKEGIELCDGDLTSVESLEKVMEGAQFVISAIGSKKPFSKKENDKIDNMGNQNLATAAKAQSIQRLVVHCLVILKDDNGHDTNQEDDSQSHQKALAHQHPLLPKHDAKHTGHYSTTSLAALRPTLEIKTSSNVA